MYTQHQIIQHRNDVTRYFLDTEFNEDGKTIELISIGIVSDDGRELYRCSTDADLGRANEWVKANVLPHLPPRTSPLWMSRAAIRNDVTEFLLSGMTRTRRAQIWCYYGAYDMVVLSQLFGRMIELPDGIPMYCMDLKQYSVELGSPEHPKQAGTAHDALEDARWNKTLYEYLRARHTVVAT